MEQWQVYSEKFSQITLREQALILLTGLVIIIFSFFNFVIDANIAESNRYDSQIKQLNASNKLMSTTISALEQALQKDPNEILNQQIAQYENQLIKVDEELLKLTSDLIDPIQMRFALIKLLKLQKGVSLVSFQLMGAKPMLSSVNEETSLANEEKNNVKGMAVKNAGEVEPSSALNLYRHGIKIKLTGNYFQLRDYLTQLENLSWKFFWKEFNYELQEYPMSELEIEVYSLSTNREFIGV